jgi:hypothetical protein
LIFGAIAFGEMKGKVAIFSADLVLVKSDPLDAFQTKFLGCSNHKIYTEIHSK